MPHEPNVTVAGLPADVFSCIVWHLQGDAWQRDQMLDDVAAMRSVCRLLRLAVDRHVTHAKFHANIALAELRSMTCRCARE
jgi:hypothetical protein